MLRERRALGAAQVVYARTGSAGSRLSVVDVDRAATDGVFAGARWLHVTGITPALSPTARDAVRQAVELARSADLTVSFDVNLRRRLWSDADAAPIVRALARQADIVLGSPDELAVVTGATGAGPAGARSRRPRARPVDRRREARGGRRARPGARRRLRWRARRLPVPAPLDPVGAGDGFCAGFIAARLDGADLATALRSANACGAAAVAAVGDLAGLPDAAELAGAARRRRAPTRSVEARRRTPPARPTPARGTPPIR